MLPSGVHPTRGSWPSVDRLLQEFVETELHHNADWIELAQDRVAWRRLMATWRANWRAPDHDQSLFGRTLMLPVQKGDSVWLACVGAPVPPPRDAAAVNFRVPPHAPWHGWQIAVDGSWGWSPCGRSKIASWGLVLWCEFVSPTCWVGMGGLVDPDADGCCGSARAELDALRVALQYCICPPVSVDDAAAEAFLSVRLVTSDSLWALNVITGSFWAARHMDVAVAARQCWCLLSRDVVLRHVRGHGAHAGNCWAHACAERARLNGDFLQEGLPSYRPEGDTPFEEQTT